MISNKIFIIIIINLILFTSCTFRLGPLSFGYSTKGATTTGLETVSVQYIENRVLENNGGIVQPSFSQEFTDALKDYIQSNTNLILINGLGDADFEGEIVTYDHNPVSITADDIAAQNRYTITIKIRFTNSVNSEMDFESSFSRYEDYSSDMTFEDAQDNYTKDIVDLLIEDIFNRAFVNW
ncbi:MAG: LptE family protein [Bacteroidales bacterium]|nr:MAG: LptE family protein [Bacteroidales bacterium]